MDEIATVAKDSVGSRVLYVMFDQLQAELD